ncbi:MAG: hypothetical protein US62_C0009G0019 [Candidatus Woesebacteria bacterium GW2011_GWA1_37_8]|uniref:Uncharacterized protein n=2 Tax=Candidatus Woeseibacteriota TaxID=1752722 RepID=A0A0G0PBN5_9BACT|nr:MAG: hypothetical protein US39_C0002G0059 [Microgenomates group bacterium GW2011_GWC1_37_12b]KKQ45788.1 MAG: hypothetical protein US62_C0009G0019 [Candidatus Woesebacteria bacterium GW2011_GWA1_37_8]KKQ86676.1 MAG: hypothetical protein UT10_C0019G0036 [Candidatus Woesebacteria bacterium GW2011_GWB1_38_8b]
MVLNKHDLISDGIVDLYRAAFYLAKGSKEIGLSFFKKAKEKLGDKMSLDIRSIIFKDNKDDLLRAEKVLDEYKRLKNII